MQAVEEPIPEAINGLFDENRLRHVLDQDPGSTLKELKSTVQAINDGLREAYMNGTPVEDIVFGRAKLVDQLLITLFDHCFKKTTQPVALIAAGGYGRGELHPHSDIDLMLLLDTEEDEKTKATIENFLTLLWDSKLEIGHSVRTLDECVSEAARDVTVTTNIMEARLLAGDESLFTSMKQATGPDKIWDSRAFFHAKLEEQIQRNGKYNDTAYNLEPNIKEGHGGLRDIQMIGWVAKRHFGATHLYDLVDNKFLQQQELDSLLKGQNLLWRIRCGLHYLSGRREDRLLFDYQRQLAHDFGFRDDPGSKNNQAIEQFMQQYYRAVMELERLNEMLLQLFREAILYADVPGEPVIINETFQSMHGYIEVREKDAFKKNPVALLEIFYMIQQHPDLQGVRAETIRLIREHRYLIDDDFRDNPEAKRLFIKIIRQTRGVTQELRRMNRYGILAAYIPAFGSIVGRMQYDLFHAYTVDQHTLFVLRNMRRLSVPEFCHEHPLASGIVQHIEKPELLYLAGLFHDIAKGRSGDHSELGAVDAFEFCIKHDLSQQEAELVSWLVRYHLIMSMTAQRKDISDPDIIAEFANTVGSIERLDYLYLLTISDIRGTNPEQWNSWKDKLLSELYHKTAAVLKMGIEHQADRQESILQNRTDALRLMELKGISSYKVQSVWDRFNDEYFLRHNPGEIAWHTRSILEHGDDTSPLIKSRLDDKTSSLELFVYMPLKDETFSSSVTMLDQMSLSVVNAQVMQCNNGYSLDTFKIISADGNIQHVINASHEVVPRLKNILSGITSVKRQSKAPLSRRQKHFDVSTEIGFELSRDGKTTRLYISTADRPGLLAIIAQAFLDSGIRLHGATISTAGEKAVDYFDITNKLNDSVLSEDRQSELREMLLRNL